MFLRHRALWCAYLVNLVDTLAKRQYNKHIDSEEHTMAQLIFEQDGYQYRVYEDSEEDNCKFFHECHKDGKRVVMPQEFYNHSPYRYMTPDEFHGYCRDLRVFIQG